MGSTLGVVYTMHKAMSICISEHVPTAREGVRGRPGLQSHLKPWSGCLIKQHYEAVSRRWEGAVQQRWALTGNTGTFLTQGYNGGVRRRAGTGF